MFGIEAGPKIAAALSQGIGTLEDLKDLLPEVITDRNVRTAAQVNDQLDKLSKTFTAGLSNAVLTNADALLTLASGLSSVAQAAIRAAGGLARFFGGVKAMSTEALEADLERLNAKLALDVEGTGQAANRQRRQRAIIRGRVADIQAELAARRALNAAEEEAQRPTEAEPLPALPDDPFEAIRNLDPILKLNAEIEKLRDLFAQIKEDPEALAELGGLDKVQANVDAAIASIEGEIEALSQSPVLKSLEDGLAQSITRGVTDGADGALSAFASLLQQMALKALQTNLSSILSGALGGLGGAVSGIPVIGGLFPGRQRGGTVTQGRSYLVGERGPELFTPGMTGSIAPSGSFGAGFTYAPVVTINGGATEQDRQLFANALDAQKAEIFEALARRSA